MLFYHFTTLLYLRPDLAQAVETGQTEKVDGHYQFEFGFADLPPLNRGDAMGLPQLAGPLVWLTTDEVSVVAEDGACCVGIKIKLRRDDHRLCGGCHSRARRSVMRSPTPATSRLNS